MPAFRAPPPTAYFCRSPSPPAPPAAADGLLLFPAMSTRVNSITLSSFTTWHSASPIRFVIFWMSHPSEASPASSNHLRGSIGSVDSLGLRDRGGFQRRKGAVVSGVQACSLSTVRLNLVLTRGIPPAFHGGVHLFTPPSAIGSAPGISAHAIACPRRSLPRVCRHRASTPQGSSTRNEFCLFKYPHEPINVRYRKYPRRCRHRSGWVVLRHYRTVPHPGKKETVLYCTTTHDTLFEKIYKIDQRTQKKCSAQESTRRKAMGVRAAAEESASKEKLTQGGRQSGGDCGSPDTSRPQPPCCRTASRKSSPSVFRTPGCKAKNVFSPAERNSLRLNMNRIGAYSRR